jgi:hypothetical protein
MDIELGDALSPALCVSLFNVIISLLESEFEIGGEVNY